MFLISNLLPGEYEVKIIKQGFKTYISNVTIQVGDTANTEAAVDYCLRHPPWRLSLQIHKLVGLP